jgi:hypothetical protein
LFSTRFEERGFDVSVPREVLVEVRGTTTATFNATVNAYGNTALSLIPVIALAANAAINNPEIRLAYDNTRGRSEREFFQRFVTELEPGSIRFGKPADLEATARLFGAIARHSDQNRLHRAAEQYRQALLNWNPGNEAMSIAHLWIAVEALTKVALRREVDAAGLSDARQLADRWHRYQASGRRSPPKICLQGRCRRGSGRTGCKRRVRAWVPRLRQDPRACEQDARRHGWIRARGNL